MQYLDKYEKMRGHKILTQELLKRFKELGRQEEAQDPIVVTKFFHPYSNWTWWATEFSEEEELFFGFVEGFEKEWGYFSLDDMLSCVKGLPMERDCYFKECTFSQRLK